MKVYLAGPITGLTYKGCTDWRTEAKQHLKDHNIDGYDPMRGKAYLSKEEQVADLYTDHTMSSINGINVRDFNDCKTSDAIIVNLLGAKKVSIGTVMEIAWARAFQKPVIIAMERDNIHDHGMLTFGNIIVPSLEEAVYATIQILKP